MILAEAQISPEIIFVLLALIASGVKTYFDRKKAASSDLEEDDDVYDQYREEIARQQNANSQAEIWPKPVPKRAAPPRPQNSPPPIPTPNSIRDVAQTLAVNLQPHLKKIATPKLSAAEQKALSDFQKNSQSIGSKIPRQRPTGLRRILSDPQSIKQAIVLNEILSKPKGL